MHYTMTTPCAQCPFLKKHASHYDVDRLNEFLSGEFPCHKSAELAENEMGGAYEATEDSVHCAGALIALEKRDMPHQMMRIMERLGMYDRTKLNMAAPVV
jgi:hypothetical protein